jgi:hypothetical protein
MAKPAQAATPKAPRRTARKNRTRKPRTIQHQEEQQNQQTLTRSQIAYQGFDETGSAFLGAHRTQGKTLETTSLMDVAIWARTTGYANGVQRSAQTRRRTNARNVRGDKKAKTNEMIERAAA